ncbi:hypothetical protein [Noviherbaspirillum sp.]|uniref:hypothetical protein n=1 Tax=Noviherbaspirillum sp. TaxID=1926288 RepID=UPI002FE1BFA9
MDIEDRRQRLERQAEENLFMKCGCGWAYSTHIGSSTNHCSRCGASSSTFTRATASDLPYGAIIYPIAPPEKWREVYRSLHPDHTKNDYDENG